MFPFPVKGNIYSIHQDQNLITLKLKSGHINKEKYTRGKNPYLSVNGLPIPFEVFMGVCLFT